jgi:hypothetical protein
VIGVNRDFVGNRLQKVLVIGVNRDFVGNRLQHMLSFLERHNDGKHLLIMDILVDLCWFELSRKIRY